MSDVEFTIVHIGNLSVNKYWDETQRVRHASSTCTLLESGDCRLIVDPAPEPDRLEESLFATTGLRADAVDMVFVTHQHGDHRMGLDLFRGRPWLMAAPVLEEWAEGGAPLAEQFEPADGRLPDGVALFATPGHTPGHHSLLVDGAWGSVVVAGDAALTMDFYRNQDGFRNTWDWEKVAESILQMREVADYIIPGHGNYFPADVR